MGIWERMVTFPWCPLPIKHFVLDPHTPSALPTFPSHELLRLNQMPLLSGPNKYHSPLSFGKAPFLPFEASAAYLPNSITCMGIGHTLFSNYRHQYFKSI